MTALLLAPGYPGSLRRLYTLPERELRVSQEVLNSGNSFADHFRGDQEAKALCTKSLPSTFALAVGTEHTCARNIPVGGRHARCCGSVPTSSGLSFSTSSALRANSTTDIANFRPSFPQNPSP
jgi:hypothetical protein